MTCGVTQPHGLGLGVPATPAFVLGVSAGLRSRAEPGRVLVAHWKHDELPDFCPDSYGELSYHARQRRMGRRSMLVCVFGSRQNCFRCIYVILN